LIPTPVGTALHSFSRATAARIALRSVAASAAPYSGHFAFTAGAKSMPVTASGSAGEPRARSSAAAPAAQTAQLA
jgi:hypothetical protein